MEQEGSFNKEVVLPHVQGHAQQVAMSPLPDAACFLQKKGISLFTGLSSQYDLGQGHPAVFTSDTNTGYTFVVFF